MLTTNGYTEASNLKVGDVLVSTEIPGLGINFTFEEMMNWSNDIENINIVPDKETTIKQIGTSTAQESVSINGEFYSGSHYVLIKRDGIAKMMATINLLDTDELWSTDTNTWIPITELIVSYIPHQVVSINCEPYDIFYTQHFLVYDGYQIEE